MGKVTFASRRQAAGVACIAIGGLAAFLLLSLPQLVQLDTWPPWADLALDQDGIAARASTTGKVHVVEGRRKRKENISWVLEVRLQDGPHSGKTSTVFCTEDWGCPRGGAGLELAVEVSKSDASVARLRGRRFSVIPFGIWVALMGLGVVASLVALVGVGLCFTGAKRQPLR